MKIISVYGAIRTTGAARIAAGIGIILACATSAGNAYNIDGIIDSLSRGAVVAARMGGSAGTSGAVRRPAVSGQGGGAASPDMRRGAGGRIEAAWNRGKRLGAYIPLIHPLIPVNGYVFPLAGGLLLAALLIQKNYGRIQRMFDIVGAITVLSFFFPVLAFAAIMIKIDSPGPVLLRQVRVGVNRRNAARRRRERPGDRRRDENPGSLFTIFKLRTMRADAESATGPVWARENDNRITRVGSILRKTHVDEIPQFMNVLKGDMCIIGPRPERPLFIRRLSTVLRNYDRRLRVKPGITGLAQVRYRYAASVEDTKKKLRYDLLYVSKRGPGMDLRILAKTVNMVVSMRGAR